MIKKSNCFYVYVNEYFCMDSYTPNVSLINASPAYKSPLSAEFHPNFLVLLGLSQFHLSWPHGLPCLHSLHIIY